MKLRTKHIIRIRSCIAVLCALWTLASCSGDSAPFIDGEEEATCFLKLKVGVLETRNGNNVSNLPSCELMQSLRVVVLNEKEVEFNRSYNPLNNADIYSLVIPVEPGKKTIYLVANERSLDGILQGKLNASAGTSAQTFTDNMKGAVFTVPEGGYGEGANNIPMTSVYEIDTETLPKDGNHIDCGTFYVVRTMTKFSFVFENRRVSGKELYVKSWTLSDVVTDKAYLMPYFEPTKNVWGQKFIPNPSIENPDAGKWEPLNDESWNEKNNAWIEWLDKVSDESNKNPNKPSADENGWLTCYKIPSTALSTSLKHEYDGKGLSVPRDGGEHDGNSVKYLPESETPKEPSPDEPLAFEGEQEYFVNVVIEEDGKEHNTFTKRPLPNLRSLFRNTHVQVYIRFGSTMKDDAIYAKIIDWERMEPVDGTLVPEN